MPTYPITISPSRCCVFAALLPFLFLFQGCQSEARLLITDKNTASDEVQQHPGRPLGGIVPSHDLPPPVTQQATLPILTQPLPNVSDNAPPSSQLQAQLPAEAFGANEWRKYFGVDAGGEPALPRDIESILNAKAPFRLDNESSPQYVRDNHLLVLIPAKANGEPFTLNKLGKLARRYFSNNQDGFRFYCPFVCARLDSNFSNTCLPRRSYWVLMTRDVLQGTLGKTYREQQREVGRYSREGYTLPSTLEAATSILAHYVRSGEQQERLFEDRYTWCASTQLVDSTICPLVGGFKPAGPGVYSGDSSRYGSHAIGVSGCRKF